MIDIPLGNLFENFVEWLEIYGSGLFDIISYTIELIVANLNYILMLFPTFVLIIIFTALAYWIANKNIALFTLVGLLLIEGMSLWPETIQTLAMILTAGIISLGFGIPLGIIAAKKDIVNFIIKPILDFMQTMPPFVYLIPAVIFFGMGLVPGVIATVIFSMPPAIRLTNLGIRQVDKEVIEAANSFGSTSLQILYKIELPLAIPTIMAGINQTIMLALSMVVIASMIGAGGLGGVVYQGIGELDIAMGFEGGIGVVILAIVLDRITQNVQNET